MDKRSKLTRSPAKWQFIILDTADQPYGALMVEFQDCASCQRLQRVPSAPVPMNLDINLQRQVWHVGINYTNLCTVPPYNGIYSTSVLYVPS